MTTMRTRVRALLTIGLSPLVVFGGCTVGGGAGNATGPLWVLGCSTSLPEPGDYGTQAAPVDFSLNPIFFAGVPIEDVSMTVHENRLVIRMQRNAGPLEFNDTLSFDIQNSFEVARCVRGRINPDGTPDWDVPARPEDAWCDWTGRGGTTDGGGADGGGGATDGGTPVQRGRVRLTRAGFVQVSLALLQTCPLEEGAALVGHSDEGWIEFLDFGTAAQPDLPPNMRTAFEGTDFKVNFGERLRATFHVDLVDDRVIIAERMNLPVPSPRIGGTLDGRFDFDLERGRAAQPFP